MFKKTLLGFCCVLSFSLTAGFVEDFFLRVRSNSSSSPIKKILLLEFGNFLFSELKEKIDPSDRYLNPRVEAVRRTYLEIEDAGWTRDFVLRFHQFLLANRLDKSACLFAEIDRRISERKGVFPYIESASRRK